MLTGDTICWAARDAQEASLGSTLGALKHLPGVGAELWAPWWLS